jgi:hypothetical protein
MPHSQGEMSTSLYKSTGSEQQDCLNAFRHGMVFQPEVYISSKQKKSQHLCPTAPWNQGSRVIPLTGVRQRSHLQHYFFFTLSWRNGLALKSGFNRYIEAVVTATLKPINRHPQTYIQSFVMPLPKYKKNKLQTLNVFDFILGIFSCSSL